MSSWLTTKLLRRQRGRLAVAPCFRIFAVLILTLWAQPLLLLFLENFCVRSLYSRLAYNSIFLLWKVGEGMRFQIQTYAISRSDNHRGDELRRPLWLLFDNWKLSDTEFWIGFSPYMKFLSHRDWFLVDLTLNYVLEKYNQMKLWNFNWRQTTFWYREIRENNNDLSRWRITMLWSPQP